MIDPSWKTIDISTFRGVQSYLDSTEGDIEQALEAVNVEYRAQGETLRTRRGFGIATNAASVKAAGMFNWVSEIGNYLVWLHPGVGVKIGNIRAADFSASITTVLAEITSVGIQFHQDGNRLYFCLIDNTQRSSLHGYVIVKVGSTFYADKLFTPPITSIAGSVTEPGAGRITAGVHYVGFIMEDRSGYVGRPNPDTGVGVPGATTFSRVTFTATGNKNASWTITPSSPWPSNVVSAKLLYTTVANPALLLRVPDAIVDVNGGTSNPITFTWNISDAELRQAATENEEIASSVLLFLYSQDVGGNAPFKPYTIFSYGDRTGYVTQLEEPDGNKVCSILMSERGHGQRIILERGLVRLPNQLPITTAFELNGQVCIIGPDWTATTSDTGGDPIEWSIPEFKNQSIGSPALKGITVDSVNKYALLGSKSGLFPFDGFSFPTLPLSYAQTDKWNTINWNYASTFEIKNDVVNKVVYVLAPTGSTPTYKLWAWSYRDFNTKNMEYWWKYADFAEITLPSYPVGGLAIVQNDTPTAHASAANRREVWLYSSTTATNLRRQKTELEDNVYRDGSDGSPEVIELSYTPRNIPPKTVAALHTHHGLMFKASGSGTLNIRVEALNDSSNYMDLSPIILSATPTDYELAESDLLSHKAHYKFTLTGTDCYVVFNMIRFFFSVAAMHI